MNQDTGPQVSQGIPVYQRLMNERGANISFGDYLALCFRRGKWFALSIAISLGIAVLYVLMTPKVYTRSMQVMILDEDGNSQGLASSLSYMGLFSSSSNVANELLAFQSPALIGDVINRIGLRANYTYNKRLRPVPLYGDSLVVAVELPDIKPLESMSMKIDFEGGGKVRVHDMVCDSEDAAVDDIVALGDTVDTPVGRMVVKAGPNYSTKFDSKIAFDMASMPDAIEMYQKKLSEGLANEDATVLDFTIKDNDVRRADDFLNAMIAIYDEKWVEQKAKMAVATSEFINERLNMIERELGNIDDNIASYKGEHLVPDVQAASEMYMANANESTRQQLEVRTQIDITKSLLEYLQSPVNAGKLLPGNLGISNEGIARQIEEYNKLLLERDQLLTSAGDESLIVKELDGSINSLKGALSASLSTQDRMLNTHLRALEKSDRATNAKIASSPNQAKYLLSVGRQQKVKESLYIFLLQKREENELSLAFTPSNTRVITPPMGQMRPSSPVVTNVLIIAAIIGLFVPAIVIFFSEMLNTRIRNRADLESVKAPFIGEIPEESSGKNRLNRWHRRWREYVGNGQCIEEPPSMVVKPHSHSVINESFRIVRSNLEFMIRGGKNKVAMVTSFNPGSGKSFVSLNLGAAMAIKRKHMRVVIIDLDLRRASLSHVAGNPGAGVSDYLSEATDDVMSLVTPTDLEGLSVIAVGTIPPNPSELLYSPRLRQLIDKAREMFDFIILDCPPTDIVADSTIITPLADMTIFVVRAGLLDRRLLPDLNRFYDTRRFNNLMVILNGTTSITTPYRRHAYHSYYHTRE